MAAAPSSSPAKTPEPRSGWQLRLAPKPDGRPRILVTISGPAARHFFLEKCTREEVVDLHARDDDGDVPTAVEPRASGVVIELGRTPRGRVTLEYARSAVPFSLDASTGLDPNHWVGSGESLLALPETDADAPTRVDLSIEAAVFGPYARAASSFGVSAREHLDVSMNGLRRATFVAGNMGHAILDGPEGVDRGAWLGYTSFDPRAAVAEVAGFRSALRQYFSDASVVPFTLLLVADSRPAGEFDVARRTSSALVRVGQNQTYNGPLRVAVGQQALREWIGATLFVGDPAEPGRARWFTGGVSRYVARELCFRFGLMTPTEYLAEVDELERIALTSPEAARTNDELAGESSGIAVALQTARGAHHAADLDARLRAKSGGKRSLDHVLSSLYARARKASHALPESEWVDMLRAELGDAAVLRFEQEVKRGVVTPLPRDALGRCFLPVRKTWDTFALGYQLDPTSRVVKQVVPGSPAERAGLRSGDELIREKHRDGDPSVRVSMTLERAGQQLTVQYFPVGARVSGRGFRRLPTIKDDDCPRR